MYLAAIRGDPDDLARRIEAARLAADSAGQGAVAPYIHWVQAILNNGRGRYAEAQAAATEAAAARHPFVSMWALPELVEAAARAGEDRIATRALDTLTESTRAGGTDAGLGVEARSRALVTTPGQAESSYREAIERLGRTRMRTDLARAHLLYGEWLRRGNRRLDAREQLRLAHGMLAQIGMEAFAERARRELLATGEAVRRRAKKSPSTLTAQEMVIARLAVDGRTNAEIGSQLFLSARTIEWHMRHILTKLGITSRRELAAALANG
jgi:ATP/maltotriose-dependent transcriptional regulator MalT